MTASNMVRFCPRCLGAIPNRQNAGRYPGATSRADESTAGVEICGPCGSDEIYRLVPLEAWPLSAVDAHPDREGA